MKTQFYDEYPDAFSQISDIDISAYGGKFYSVHHLPIDEAVHGYPEMEWAISGNCHKLAKALARGTHHTVKEWHDTIVVTLMSQLFPGFSDDEEQNADKEQS